ncbi:M15 family metallopeptidase [Brachybacterium hainanense]|uniref:M15 family metallopeptidase n=1 Tax=Brachybacterium hainanense TaxID=1541174 RepID=A0ABV6RA81_9MICO
MTHRHPAHSSASRRSAPGRSPILPLIAAAGLLLLALTALGTFASGTPEQGGAAAGSTGRDGGRIRAGEDVSVFDVDHPAVAGLDPDLRDAVQRAAADAENEGTVFHVTSGWRSPAYQQHLLDRAVAERGSAQEAARWVASPETSAHVAGDAIDIGGVQAQDWIARRGAGYGLCRVYENEPWHVELRPEAARSGCPQPFRDPTEDPRLR